MRSMSEMESFISRFPYLDFRTLTEPFQRHNSYCAAKISTMATMDALGTQADVEHSKHKR
jgi:hypothetical protein